MMKTQRPTSRTEVKTETLTPLEEKVVRMRHGLRAPGDLVLEQVGQDFPETAEMLAKMEQRAFETVGARDNKAKRKIVASLRRKDR